MSMRVSFFISERKSPDIFATFSTNDNCNTERTVTLSCSVYGSYLYNFRRVLGGKVTFTLLRNDPAFPCDSEIQ